jgi:hypothetical protein
MTARMIVRNKDGIPCFTDDAPVERDDRADWQIAESFGFKSKLNGATQVIYVLFSQCIIERSCHGAKLFHLLFLVRYAINITE